MNYFFHCEKLREQREKEINDQSLRRALHDDELDAELVGRPPASCTGFYPRTGKLSLSLQATNSSDYGFVSGIIPCKSSINKRCYLKTHSISISDDNLAMIT